MNNRFYIAWGLFMLIAVSNLIRLLVNHQATPTINVILNIIGIALLCISLIIKKRKERPQK